jgi:MYXO-CTERM domain-containing protein
VTYNEGKSGDAVVQTELGWIFNLGEPGYGQNRGCMSQWGARCLENENGYGYEDILRFYYGDDIAFTQAQGPCVMDLGGDGDTTSTSGETDSTSTDDTTGETGSTSGADDGTCTIGSLGCNCTQGGGCDPGLVCEEGSCVPDGPNEDDGASSSGGESADEIGDDGLPPGFGEEGDDGCACSSDGGEGSRGIGGLAVIAVLALVRRRR